MIDSWRRQRKSVGTEQESERAKSRSLKKPKLGKRAILQGLILFQKRKQNYLVTMVQTSKSQSDESGTNDIVIRARKQMIYLGKVLPFLICMIVAISYLECLKALFAWDLLEFGDGVYLNKPISFFIGKYFELDVPTLAFVTIISIAIRTCKWNKLAILYLAFQMFEKSYFATHAWDNIEGYYIVAVLNILVCSYLIIKGLTNL